MYKKFVLKSFPSATFPQDLSCFDLQQFKIEDLQPKQGEALIRVIYIGSDPLLRTWISGAKSYLDPVRPGSPVPSFGLARVIRVVKQKGKKTRLQANDWVFGMLTWSQFMVCDYNTIQKLPLDLGEQMFKYLTIYGPPGFTSFCSIKHQILPFNINNRAGQQKARQDINIVISSAAGGLGLVTAEYLSKLGYRNIYGIAGSEEKCQMAVKMGCKACLNYKNYYDREDIRAKEFESAIRQMMNGQTCDLYYENVGEDMLSSMLNVMSDHGKIIMCGATATYNNWGSKEGVRNMENIISKRIQLKGILYFDVPFGQRVQLLMEMASIDVQGCHLMMEGIEQLPTTYRNMIHGQYIGKPIIQLWDNDRINQPEPEQYDPEEQ